MGAPLEIVFYMVRADGYAENIRDLNLAAVKRTTVQASRLLL
jgi:hypothetical protein